MSIVDNVRKKLHNFLSGNGGENRNFKPEIKREPQKTSLEEKVEKLAEIAENRRKLREKVGDKPFEIGYNGSTYDMPGCMIIDCKTEEGIKKLTIVNPVYQFDTPDTFKLVGGRMFERRKMYDELTGSNMVLGDTDVKNLSADEVRDIRRQQEQKIIQNARLSRENTQ